MTTPASFPAIRCHIGDWTYYSAVVPFDEIATRIQRAKEINSHPGLNEMIQRELGNRVRDITSYLQTQPQRFFNSIVVGVYAGSPDWFPLDIEDSESHPLNLSERASEAMGVLQLSGEEKLFAVDGQHRVEAIKAALRETPTLKDEELVVLFIAHRETAEGTIRTRRLFTTLNKYAVPVKTNEIIALDEDDAFAVITRKIVNEYDGLANATSLPDQLVSLVRFKGPRLLRNDQYSITTIQTLYKLAIILAIPRNIPARGRRVKELKQSRPSQETIDQMYNDNVSFWEGLRSNVPAMNDALGSDPADRMAGKYRTREGGHILFRPVGQEVFARAVRILMDRGLPINQGISALAGTQLMIELPPWRHVMWDPSQNTMNRLNLELAESLLLFMVDESPFDPKFDLDGVYKTTVDDPSAKLDNIPKGQPAR